MSSLKDMYSIRNEMKKVYKKIILLNKKKDRFGLNEQEEIKLAKLRSESYILNEELIENHLNITVIPILATEDYHNALEAIKTIIPWNGGLIRRDEDYNKIAEVDLSEEQKEFVEKKLTVMHILMLNGFEVFCSTESGYEYMREVSKVITKDDEGDVLDLLAYLDARYREFAELLDIYLEEVEIYWDEGDQKDE